jgi:hypothetical protein
MRTYDILQPPWPLQSFFPLHECLSVPHPPCPLQSFWPRQACFAAFGATLDGCVSLGGLFSLQAAPAAAPARIPIDAAVTAILV